MCINTTCFITAHYADSFPSMTALIGFKLMMLLVMNKDEQTSKNISVNKLAELNIQFNI